MPPQKWKLLLPNRHVGIPCGCLSSRDVCIEMLPLPVTVANEGLGWDSQA